MPEYVRVNSVILGVFHVKRSGCRATVAPQPGKPSPPETLEADSPSRPPLCPVGTRVLGVPLTASSAALLVTRLSPYVKCRGIRTAETATEVPLFIASRTHSVSCGGFRSETASVVSVRPRELRSCPVEPLLHVREWIFHSEY